MQPARYPAHTTRKNTTMQRPTIAILVCLGLGLGLNSAATALAEQLITPAEAALPSPPDTGMTLRGITRGPAIEQVEPAADAKHLTSPLALKIAFTARNNTSVDKDSVKVTYLKSPAVDLTARLKAHLTPDGIEMKQAELPPGTHVIRIDLKDSNGRAASAVLKLTVAGK
jgi:hypothetical protein